MAQLYLISAIVGGSAFLCQFLFSLFGFGHHDVGGHDMDVSHDVAHDGDSGHETSWLVGIITFRSVIAALTCFGLAGLAASGKQWGAAPSLGAAIVTGLAAMLLVAGMMKSLARLKADGTIRMDKAVGHSGTVYLSIPGHNGGIGKVTLNLQGRTVECHAVTFQNDLPTGAKIIVTQVVNPDTVEVVAAPECGRMAHV